MYKIYKLVNDQMPDKIYYGKTRRKLERRLNAHKNTKTCSSRILFEYGNVEIILIDECNTPEEAKQRERWWIEKNKCINRIIPGRTIKEWYEANKEKMKERYEANKEKIKEHYEANKEKRKEYYEANKEKKKEYYEANKEKYREYQKKYREAKKVNC